MDASFMAKFLFILTGLLGLQVCLNAASQELYPADTKYDEARIEEGGPTLDEKPQEISEEPRDSDVISSQGQRQKRFYNYFNFGFTPFGPYNPTFVKRDDSQDTGVYGTEDPLSQIFKRVQFILNFTRQQAFSPPPAPQIPIPYIPVFYIPSAGCGCTPDNNNQGPSNDEEPSNEVPPAPFTTTTMIPTTNNAPPMIPTNNNVPVTSSPNADANKTTPDLITRFGEMGKEEDSGARPISFEPIKPDRPLSRPAPPVEHGSVQAGSNGGESLADKQDAPTTTTDAPFVHAVAAQPHLPTNMIPTLCDGAVLTCCHRPEVTYSCFTSQGCPNPASADNPCDANVILNVIRKFQYYYANRNVSNSLS